NTYGPRMHIDDGRAVPNFITQALHGEPLTIYGDGEQTRSFCYVDDLIDGILKLLFSQEHEPINIGNPVETSIKEFAETINSLISSGSELVYQPDARSPGDPQQRRPDITRAENLLGWSPNIALAEGLERTIEYFKEQLQNNDLA
ncbi:MAG: GDP-mannose 4,6-dehydratase, partial [Anaerolineae bacterium]|nr:GDP-mannose 4,6-dehydratase [Anaerolineae bacterium]